MYKLLFLLALSGSCYPVAYSQLPRQVINFNNDWRFRLAPTGAPNDTAYVDADWRLLNLPHDWSIEGNFDEKSPAGVGGGALNGGTGWYRKTFKLAPAMRNKRVYIEFDGVYQKSEVWINGHYLGLRPYGFSSFRYELTTFLRAGNNKLAVKVDNAQQPNARWYSGSGIYRNVRLVATEAIAVAHWGTFITTQSVTKEAAVLHAETKLSGTTTATDDIQVATRLLDQQGKTVAQSKATAVRKLDSSTAIAQTLQVDQPHFWSTEDPYLYRAVTRVTRKGKLLDEYVTVVGIRSFHFDAARGFFLNGKATRINGVCNHHDLGSLGAAVNTRAMERQLELLKAMGCNAIRTSHNPPAPELLDLCDRMGFIVMDEAFDMWKNPKNPFDYSLYWDEWHQRDLQDLVRRDRNHPSVIIWSIGNEIPEQWDSTGTTIAAKLAAILRSLDTTRPITAGLNDPRPENYIYRSGVLDLVGFNYHHQNFESFPKKFPGKVFIGAETVSALATRGHYDRYPADSIRRWPERWDKPFDKGNKDLTVSAYDHVSAPWGSTHEENLKLFNRHPFLSGQFIWTGFDYLGEPTPYGWPARSSYFGILDLAGFPKDVYYLYQSQWSQDTVLHVLPHWNWKAGDTVDVWCYYSQADEVELFLNGKSAGKRTKVGEDLHVSWRIPWVPGTLEAVSKKGDRILRRKMMQTAGSPAQLVIEPDRHVLTATGNDLSFLKVSVRDANGILVPLANDTISFTIDSGDGKIIATDNGRQTSLEPFQSSRHSAFNGLCLGIVQAGTRKGPIRVTASAKGLKAATVLLQVQ